MTRPYFALISPIVIAYSVVLTLYEAEGLDNPRQINCTRFHCTPNFTLPQVRPGVDDVVVFENNRTALQQHVVFVSCDLVRFGRWILVSLDDTTEDRTIALTEPNLKNVAVRNPWMSCRFQRTVVTNKGGAWKSRREYTPPRTLNQPFDSYLNVSLAGTRGSGSVTHVFMNDTGIFVQEQLLALWGANDSSISSDPGFKYLNSRDGHPCYSICTQWPNPTSQWLPTMCHSGVYRDNQRCDPRDDYDIRKYAVDGVLSAEGLPCITECKWGFRSERMGDGWGCVVRSYDEDPQMGYFGWCSPSAGLTFRGDNCTGPCSFTNVGHSSCPVAGDFSDAPCSA